VRSPGRHGWQRSLQWIAKGSIASGIAVSSADETSKGLILNLLEMFTVSYSFDKKVTVSALDR
jgi:hypothetical protein